MPDSPDTLVKSQDAVLPEEMVSVSPGKDSLIHEDTLRKDVINPTQELSDALGTHLIGPEVTKETVTPAISAPVIVEPGNNLASDGGLGIGGYVQQATEGFGELNLNLDNLAHGKSIQTDSRPFHQSFSAREAKRAQAQGGVGEKEDT